MTEELNPIARRIAELIECKTGGSRVQFAERIGWTKQRLTNVLAGKSIGLTTIETMLRSFPDLNARWLIFGEGNMLEIAEPRFGSRFDAIMSFEKYMPVMTEAEVSLLAGGKSNWSATDIERWDMLLEERKASLRERLAPAYERQGMTLKI